MKSFAKAFLFVVLYVLGVAALAQAGGCAAVKRVGPRLVAFGVCVAQCAGVALEASDAAPPAPLDGGSP